MAYKRKKIIIIGGGAAGFFTAANLDGDKYEILLLERSKRVLQKVKIAGGGRCNVTHACFDPKELVEFYPRGHKELLSVFTKFQPGDTMAWFDERGLELKIEEDQRVFPVTDDAQSVLDVLIDAAQENGVEIKTQEGVHHIKPTSDQWMVKTKKNNYKAEFIVFCTGGSPKAYKMLEHLNLKLIPLVPSLFTFNIQHQLLKGFMGTSFPEAIIKIPKLKAEDSGSLLITHWGLSGPAVLKLSAWCARELAKENYQFTIEVNFIGLSKNTALACFKDYAETHTKQSVGNAKPFDLSNRFWQNILKVNKIDQQKNLANISKKEMHGLIESICASPFKVNGKSTFKEEFVTSGGVDLQQIDFKTMEAKPLNGFYLAGEVLDVDALTGGFNFQACWSEAWLIAQHLNNV